MIFTSVEIQNFLRIREGVVIELKDQGLVLVQGENHDSASSDSNGCLAGDTLIDCPRNLLKYPKGIPIRELVGTKPYVYCWVNGRLTIRQASRVFLSKQNAPTVRVCLSKYETNRGSGREGEWLPPQELIGTFDHPVLLADGKTWKKLGNLNLEIDSVRCIVANPVDGGLLFAGLVCPKMNHMPCI